MLGAAGFLVAFYATKTHDASQSRAQVFEKIQFDKKKIIGGKNDTVIDKDIISDDGVIGNPKKYPPSGAYTMLCALEWLERLTLVLRCRRAA